MKNTVLLLLFILVANTLTAQKYSTKNGNIHFEASVPLFEDVDAKNSNTTVILNADTGDIASVAMVKGFKFKVSLMEEHFNENYAESVKYPKTTFVGKILNFKKEGLSEIPKNYTISGTLNFHGVDHKTLTVASIYLKDNTIYITGNFIAKPADYNVKIPKMVTKKIAENVNVDYQFILIKS